MIIAQVNKYLRPKGGADICNLQQARLLRERGHRVVLLGMPPAEGGAEEFPLYTVSPVDLQSTMSPWEQLRTAGRLLYSTEARAVMEELIAAEKPNIIHCHNIYHQLSPSVIAAAADHGIPCVMTLHDYKLTCGIYTHWRDGHVCEQCRGRRFANCLRFRCTGGSVSRSLLNSLEMYLHHNVLNLYGRLALCISPSRFLRDKVVAMGYRGRIEHLGNCVDLNALQPRYGWDEPRCAYFGRLSREKGLMTLLQAVKGLEAELLVIGTGPMERKLKQVAETEDIENVRFAGYRTGEDLMDLVSGSMFTVLPSEWYENNPRSVIESFALGTAVVGARIGGIPELVGEGRGLCFRSGDARDLRSCIVRMLSQPDEVRQMGRRSRRFAETHLSPDAHYEGLMRLYEELLCGKVS
jgi:glycosyltransferase involved in cell wall biosynthesis